MLADLRKSDVLGPDDGTSRISEAVASRLPLVHRTGSAWREILRAGALEPRTPPTAWEAADGRREPVYFFWGAPSFPEGSVAFVWDQAPEVLDRATFTPFDSGGLGRHARPASVDEAAWTAEARAHFLARHHGLGVDLAVFGASFLASHFRTPTEYVRRPQFSAPDVAPYHGLTDQDRRCWTIEVACEGSVTTDSMAHLCLGHTAYGADVPDALLDRVIVDQDTDDVGPLVVQAILRGVETA